MKEREKLSSRLGFILISAGCAVGLGNVWRFPFITGQYGGGAFVLIYLFFLILLGLPIMVMEFSVGRASRKSVSHSFDVLEPKGTRWHGFKAMAVSGNYILMMFYTVVGGWMMNYVVKMSSGSLTGLEAADVSGVFDAMLKSPAQQIGFMVLAVLLGFLVCRLGLKNGVERVSKVMMSCLFLIMIVLCVRSLTLPNAIEGLKFYLIPDFNRMLEAGISNVIFAAMSQAFFTLSIGMGSLAIFGSYIGKERSLFGESLNIMALDTVVALLSGLIIFPAAAAYNIPVDSGPGLVFITLPNIFNSMPGGQIWGTLFFIFLSFAALTTIIAVFENIVAFAMDSGLSRKKAVWMNIILLLVLSLPCALGFNLWSGFQPLGAGSTIQDLEDFIVSSNILPLGSLIYLMFCTRKCGWGWEAFIEEANAGRGLRVPEKIRGYLRWGLPCIVIFIFFQGYYAKFTGFAQFWLPLIIVAGVMMFPLSAWLSQRKS